MNALGEFSKWPKNRLLGAFFQIFRATKSSVIDCKVVDVTALSQLESVRLVKIETEVYENHDTPGIRKPRFLNF